jgi:hypothetical protein
LNALPLLAAFAAAAAGADPPIALGREKQLFLDDFLIASTRDVKRRVQPAEKHAGNPVIRKTEDWEDPFNVLYGSVIRDGERYRAWYQSGRGVSYAESADGIEWVKPRLDLVLIDGQKTNILFRKQSETTGSEELPYYQELFGVSKDPREADPARRYKMGFLSLDWKYTGPREVPWHKGQRRGVGVAASPDGLHWMLVDSFATDAITDGATHWMFDPAHERYVLFGRVLKTLPEVEAAWSKYDWYPGWHSGRAVGRIESTDFMKWSHNEPAAAPVVLTVDIADPPGTEIYSMNVFPYEAQYIGLLQVFHARPEECTLDIQLTASRDGERFTRVGDRSPIITVGPIGSWDRFNQSLANNPPLAVGDELRIYYGGRTYRHSPYQGKDTGPRAGGIGFATVKKDRFVALEASFDGGEVATRLLLLRGPALHLNAKADFGEILVEALDLAGKVLARSKPVRADALDIAVEWQEGAAPDLDHPVVLKFTLKNACLYALWCI